MLNFLIYLLLFTVCCLLAAEDGPRGQAGPSPQRLVITPRAEPSSHQSSHFPKSAWICGYDVAGGRPFGCPNESEQVCIRIPFLQKPGYFPIGADTLLCCSKTPGQKNREFRDSHCTTAAVGYECHDHGYVETYYADKTTTWTAQAVTCNAEKPFCNGIVFGGPNIRGLEALYCAASAKTVHIKARSDLGAYTTRDTLANWPVLAPMESTPAWIGPTTTLHIPRTTGQIPMTSVMLNTHTGRPLKSPKSGARQLHAPHSIPFLLIFICLVLNRYVA